MYHILITEYWWDGDNVIGKIEVLPTPSGNILKELIKNGSYSRCIISWYGFIRRK